MNKKFMLLSAFVLLFGLSTVASDSEPTSVSVVQKITNAATTVGSSIKTVAGSVAKTVFINQPIKKLKCHAFGRFLYNHCISMCPTINCRSSEICISSIGKWIGTSANCLQRPPEKPRIA